MIATLISGSGFINPSYDDDDEDHSLFLTLSFNHSFARFTPDSDFFHHTFCTVRTVQSVCSPSNHPFTLC